MSAALIPVIGLQQVNQDMVLPEGGELNTRFLLWAIVTIIPAVLNLLSLIPFIFYDLEGEKLDTIHRELAQRRENLTGAARRRRIRRSLWKTNAPSAVPS